MRNLTYPNLKQRKECCALILLNVQTAEVIIKPISTCIHSRGIGSTKSSNKRNMLRSMKKGPNQFVL